MKYRSKIEEVNEANNVLFAGEIIVERRKNLDFTLEFEYVTRGLKANLPNYSRAEKIAHYNNKLRNVWKGLKV